MSNAFTVATSGTIGGAPYGLFIDNNNTIYVANREGGRVQIWKEGSTVPSFNITTTLLIPHSIFVTTKGDILIDDGYSANRRVVRWNRNLTRNSSIMNVDYTCWGLFVDRLDMVYCSMFDLHRVIVKSLNANSDLWSIAAGLVDCSGSQTSRLLHPRGIFVDDDLNLYVADSHNHRIQMFSPERALGTTVAGTGAPGTISLNQPSDVKLDADGYLFIVDSENHRIVGSGPGGFRCIVGCGSGGSGIEQLDNPSSLSFDSYGNLFVLDRDNHRLQKFNLIPMVLEGNSL
jgi:DNA-binding beta-propeller fold protein YncE